VDNEIVKKERVVEKNENEYIHTCGQQAKNPYERGFHDCKFRAKG
jgi:hypothetical protein